MSAERAFQPFTNPPPFELSAADRKRALNLRRNGRLLLQCDHAELVHLLLEMNDQLTLMTRHMKAHMETCQRRRLIIPTTES